MKRPALTFLFLAALSASASAAQESDSILPQAETEEEVQTRIDNAFPNQDKASGIKPDHAYGAYQRGMYLTAFQLALPRAERGDAAAQTLIAELYDLGKGIARDTKKAAEWYALAADAGNREARFAYSMKLLQGRDIERDREKGIEMMRLAAEDGHPLAMFNYATHIIDQRPTSAGYRRALPYLERAAEYRLSDAYYSLAKIYIEGLATGIGDPDKGVVWLERAARSGVDTAQIEMGIALMNGLYGEKDEKQAFRWFFKAAQTGNVIAQNRLAHMYFEGVGVEQSVVEGAKWHVLASRAGRADLVLSQYLRELDDETKQKALEAANRWPF